MCVSIRINLCCTLEKRRYPVMGGKIGSQWVVEGSIVLCCFHAAGDRRVRSELELLANSGCLVFKGSTLHWPTPRWVSLW